MAEQQQDQKKETYGDPVRFRLASEAWEIAQYVKPVFTSIEYLAKHKGIDKDWVEMLQEAEGYVAAWKWTVEAFKLSLSREDEAIIRSYDTAYKQSVARKTRVTVPHGKMEGRPELMARRRLELEDEAIAVYFQALDVRAVEFKNKFWDLTNRPPTKKHGTTIEGR